MADTKISDLVELGVTPADLDEFVVVDSSDSQSKRLTYGTLKADFATSAQGDLADTALQDGDTVSLLDINGGTIDGTVIGGTTPAEGTFTTFTSTGIDDNATSTAITIDASEQVGIGYTAPNGDFVAEGSSFGLGNNLATSNATGGAFSFVDPDGTAINTVVRVGQDVGATGAITDFQLINYGSGNNAGGGNIRFINSRYSVETGLIKSAREVSNSGYMAFYTASSEVLNEAMRIDSNGKLLSPNGDAFVGTVSNSGNGAIIERGSNANGGYVKFADGTMICWSNALSVTTDIAWGTGGLYRSSGVNNATWTFPASFASLSDITLSGHAANDALVSGTVSGLSAALITGISNSNLDTLSCYVTAKGRWFV